MFSYRMARKPFFYASLCLIVFSHVTAAASFNLSSEFTDFIPGCAAECFKSFLDVNYGTGKCGSSPSLQCLCSRLGASGDTLGEGAVQCIAAERAIGYCSNREASDNIIQSAFSMCDGQPDAIRPTRDTITATLVLPPSGGKGVITFPPIPTTSETRTGLPTSLPTTLVLDTSSSPLPPSRTRSQSFTTSISLTRTSSSFLSSSTSRSPSDTETDAQTTFFTSFSKTSTSSTTTSTSTSTDEAGAVGAGGETKDDGDKLNSGQVAGISIGVLAAAGFAIGAIILARYYRRRNHPSIKTGFFPRRDTWGYKPTQGNTPPRNWVAANIGTPLDQNLPPPPPSYNRASYKPGGIGMAISPAYSRVTPQPSPMRRVSRLLPAKPILPVIPTNVGKRISNRLSRPGRDVEADAQDQQPLAGTAHRQSGLARMSAALVSPISTASSRKAKQAKAVPQGPPRLQIPIPKSGSLMGPAGRESTMTEFEEDGTISSGEKVWRPPPTTPISTTAFYVADQQGNWVLKDQARDQNRISLVGPPTAAVVSQDSPDTRTSFGAIKITNPDKLSPSPTPKKALQSILAPQTTVAPPAPPVPAPQATLAPPAEIARMASQSSSLYSQQSAPRPAAAAAGSYPLFSSHPNPAPRRSSSLQRSQSHKVKRPRENSTDSGVTMFETDDVEDDPSPVLDPPNMALSPVAESPASNIKRSPTAYPQIPMRDPRRISQQLLMNKALTEQKTSTDPAPTRVLAPAPSVQPSPTLASSTQPTGSGTVPRKMSTKNRRPISNPGLEKTGSPTMRFVEPSPESSEVAEEDISQHVPMQSQAPAFFFDPPYPKPLNLHRPAQRNSRGPPPQGQQYEPDVQQQAQQRPQQPQQQLYEGFDQRSRPNSYQQPRMHQQQSLMHDQQLRPYPQQPHPYPGQHRMHPQQMRMSNQQIRPWPQYPQQSYTYLQGPRPYNQQPYHNQQRYPQPQHPHFSQAPMNAPQRPYFDHASSSSSGNTSSTGSSLLAKRLGSERAANMSIPTDGSSNKWQRDGRESRTPRTGDSNLPSSATWRPTLTPARRGDDLILNVQ